MRLPNVIAVSILAACTPARDVPAVDLTSEPGAVKVVRGRRWIVPGAAAAEVGASATAERVGVMTAFIDLDDDDTLDPDSEPSTPCTITDDHWRCDVEDRQLTVLREDVEGGTALFVVPRWDPRHPIRYCVGTERGCDAPFVEMPARPSLVESGCAEARTIWLETTPVRRITLDARPALPLDASLRPAPDGGIEVHIAGQAPERVHAWMGRPDAPSWDSETAATAWFSSAGGLAITVPAAAVAGCPGCGVDVAVADHRRHRDASTGALVLDVRERRVHLGAGPR